MPAQHKPENARIEVIKRAIEGDITAYGELYDVYVERIYNYVYYQVGNRMTAEDITEEVFVKGWKAIRTCRGREETFASWLYRIAHNQVIDTFRQSNRNLFREDIDIAGDASPEHEAETKMERQQVLEEVLRLPEAQKQVILFKFFDGADNAEIGRIMGKRQGAIRALQMRALASLKRMLAIKVRDHGE